MNVQSRIVNVIETKQGDEVQYFTLEGIMIGGFKGGNRVASIEEATSSEKPKGGVVTAPSPHEVQRQNDRRAEDLQTPEGKLKHLKEDVT
jgi:hypothetical protein